MGQTFSQILVIECRTRGANIAIVTKGGSIFLRCMHFRRCAKQPGKCQNKIPNSNIYIWQYFRRRKPGFFSPISLIRGKITMPWPVFILLSWSPIRQTGGETASMESVSAFFAPTWTPSWSLIHQNKAETV